VRYAGMIILVWHHLDPSKKDFDVFRMGKISRPDDIDKMREEIKKCILLCPTCHRAEHIPIIPEIQNLYTNIIDYSI
jgi:hypothetical protein